MEPASLSCASPSSLLRVKKREKSRGSSVLLKARFPQIRENWVRINVIMKTISGQSKVSLIWRDAVPSSLLWECRQHALQLHMRETWGALNRTLQKKATLGLAAQGWV